MQEIHFYSAFYLMEPYLEAGDVREVLSGKKVLETIRRLAGMFRVMLNISLKYIRMNFIPLKAT